jgi:ABC-type multidrug transport system fused ATPase/permease subunit
MLSGTPERLRFGQAGPIRRGFAENTLAQKLDGRGWSSCADGDGVLASIRFDGVWKRYGSLTAVENLNLTCPEGEMLALLGPSGCGKSSTIKMAAGVEEVTSV